MSELHLAYWMAAGAALCWGLVVIFIKLAGVSGRLGVPVAMATGAIIMFVLAGDDIGLLARLTYRQLAVFMVAGVVQFAIGSALYYESIRRGALSVAVPITRAKIIVVLLLSLALGLERFAWPLLGACLLVLVGGVLVGAPDREAEAPARGRHWESVLLAVGTCLCWAVGETLMGLLPKDIPGVATNFLLLSCGLTGYLIYALASGAWREVLHMPARGVWCYMGHGTVSFALAYALFVSAIQIAGPPRVVCITSVYPLISALVGWVAFRERFAPTLALGAVLIVAGIVLLQFV